VSVGLLTRTLLFILKALAVEIHSTPYNIEFFFWIFFIYNVSSKRKDTTDSTYMCAMLFQKTKKWVSSEKCISIDVSGLLPPTCFTVSSIFTVCSRPKTHLRLSDKEPVSLNFHTKLISQLLDVASQTFKRCCQCLYTCTTISQWKKCCNNEHLRSGEGQVVGAYECGNEHSGSIKCGEFLTSWEPVTFSRRTLLHGVSK
jgi:hypothetical protein